MSEGRGGLAGSVATLGRAYARWRYTILFYSLLLTIVAAPLSGALGLDADLLELLLAANLLAAVLPIHRRGARHLLLGVLVSAWAVGLATEGLDHPALSTAGLAAWTAVALLAGAAALRFALRASSVDREHIYAALSAYVLVGVFLGVLYWVLERNWPGSFVIAGAGVEGGFSRSSAIYFSFVTLATLGYGDVVPRSEVARGLAIAEAVAGQLYLAVMVARLVSLYVQRPSRGDGE